MPIFTAEYAIKLTIDLGSHASLFEAELAAEKITGQLFVLRTGQEQSLDREVTLTGLGENPQEHARDRLSMKRALHAFVQGYADLVDRVADEDHIPLALRNAKDKAVEALQLNGRKP